MVLGYQTGEGGGRKHSGVIFIKIWEEAVVGVSGSGNNLCKAIVSPKEGLATLPLTRRSLCRGILSPPCHPPHLSGFTLGSLPSSLSGALTWGSLAPYCPNMLFHPTVGMW